VRAKSINMEMKIAAAHALADLAREDVPDEVAVAYQGARPRFGCDYAGQNEAVARISSRKNGRRE